MCCKCKMVNSRGIYERRAEISAMLCGDASQVQHGELREIYDRRAEASTIYDRGK